MSKEKLRNWSIDGMNLNIFLNCCGKRLYCNEHINFLPKNSEVFFVFWVFFFYFSVNSPALLGPQFIIIHALNLEVTKEKIIRRGK